MQAFVVLFCLLFNINSYASSALPNDAISVVDAPIEITDRSRGPGASLVQGDDGRLSDCEEKIQNLVGRVEILEHSLKELQSKSVNRDNLDVNPAPLVSERQSSGSDVALQSSSSEEKREYDLALSALKESRFVDAETLFADFMQKHTHSELMGNAYFWYAESFYRRNEFDKAAVHYLKGYKQYPKSPKAADNLLKLALSLGELKKDKDACAMLNKLDAEYKNRPASSVKRANDAKAKYCK